jgi:hypothetical protein
MKIGVVWLSMIGFGLSCSGSSKTAVRRGQTVAASDGKEVVSPTADMPSCDGVATHFAKIIEQQFKEMPAEPPTMSAAEIAGFITEFKQLTNSICRRDKWSTPALTCAQQLDQASKPADHDRCMAQLSTEQLAGYQHDIESWFVKVRTVLETKVQATQPAPPPK